MHAITETTNLKVRGTRILVVVTRANVETVNLTSRGIQVLVVVEYLPPTEMSRIHPGSGNP